MTVEELIEKLQRLPPSAKVKGWSGFDDTETDEVYVSVDENGSVFILPTVIGREI